MRTSICTRNTQYTHNGYRYTPCTHHVTPYAHAHVRYVLVKLQGIHRHAHPPTLMQALARVPTCIHTHTGEWYSSSHTEVQCIHIHVRYTPRNTRILESETKPNTQKCIHSRVGYTRTRKCPSASSVNTHLSTHKSTKTYQSTQTKHVYTHNTNDVRTLGIAWIKTDAKGKTKKRNYSLQCSLGCKEND